MCYLRRHWAKLHLHLRWRYLKMKIYTALKWGQPPLPFAERQHTKTGHTLAAQSAGGGWRCFQDFQHKNSERWHSCAVPMWLLCHLCKSLYSLEGNSSLKPGLTSSPLVTLLCWLRKKISPSKKFALWNVSIQEVGLNCLKARPFQTLILFKLPSPGRLNYLCRCPLQMGQHQWSLVFICWNQQFNPILTRAWISPSWAKAHPRNDWISQGAIKQRASAESGTRLTGL